MAPQTSDGGGEKRLRVGQLGALHKEIRAALSLLDYSLVGKGEKGAARTLTEVRGTLSNWPLGGSNNGRRGNMAAMPHLESVSIT